MSRESVGSERAAPEQVADTFKEDLLYEQGADKELTYHAGDTRPPCRLRPGAGVEPSILTGTIVVGVLSDVPGFSAGALNPAGFDIDLMNAIGTELNTPVTPKPFTVADRNGMINSHNVTIVIATYSITKERNEQGIDRDPVTDTSGPHLPTPGS